MTVVEENKSNPLPRWSVGAIFLEALANRDPLLSRRPDGDSAGAEPRSGGAPR